MVCCEQAPEGLRMGLAAHRSATAGASSKFVRKGRREKSCVVIVLESKRKEIASSKVPNNLVSTAV